MHTSRHRVVRLGAALAALLLLATACGGGGDADGGGDGSGSLAQDYDLSGVEIRFGSKDFTEQLVLGQIAAQALEAAGAQVELIEDLASPAGPRDALLAGELDAAWEYTGTAWINYLGHDEAIDDPMEQFEAVKEEDAEVNDVFWAPPAPFDDTYGFAYRAEASDEYGIETVSDLAAFVQDNPDQATLCVDPTFASREDGLPSVEEVYGFTWPDDQLFQSDFGVIYDSVDKADPCNFAEIFTTDGRLQALELKVLEDDKGAFISYLSSVMMTADLAEENPQLADLFEEIGQPLSEERMTGLNARVDVDGEFPEDVAAAYLQEEGFIG